MISNISILIALSFVTIPISCKQRAENPPPVSELRHVLGATSVTPAQSFDACPPETPYTDAADYFAKIGRHLMDANPQTFKGPYAPGLICFRARKFDDFNSISTAKSRTVTVDTGVLSLTESQVDADVAMILAHELAHVTLQHGNRDPSGAELPSDVDHAELDRRMRLKSIFLDRKLNTRKAISIDGHTDGVFEDFVWFMTEIKNITDKITPLIKPTESSTLDESIAAAAKLRDDFGDFSNTDHAAKDPLAESNFMIRSRQLIHIFTDEIESISPLIKKAPVCDPSLPCDVIVRIAKIANYHTLRVQPVAQKLFAEMMPTDDNPETYPPYAQWIEQQADEVGYELYLRAGFKSERFGTFFKAAMAKKSPESVDACLAALNQDPPLAPDRIDDQNAVDTRHPSRCFRLYNINIAETLRHHDAYKELERTAVLLNLPETEGMLLQLRSKYAMPMILDSVETQGLPSNSPSEI